MIVDHDNSFGIHAAFYYYGKEHLYVNMLYFILEGIESNEAIYMTIAEDLYSEFVERLIPSSSVSGVRFIAIPQQKENEIERLIQEAVNQGFKGVRWIFQSSYVVKQTSKRYCLDLEKAINAVRDNATFLCAYDFRDYVTEKTNIDNEVFYKSLEIHDIIYHKMDLISKEVFLTASGYNNQIKKPSL